MSKRVNISYLFCLMLLLLTGCEQEISLAPSPNGEQEPVEILLSAKVIKVQVSTAISRSDFLDQTSFENSAQIGIFGLRNADASFTENPYLKNLAFINNAGSLTSDGKIYFPSGKTTAYLYGYYPYTTDAELLYTENEISIPVKGGLSGIADAQWTNANTDPLHATANPTIVRADVNSEGATPTQVPITLNFQHMMAQLQIMVSTENANYQLQEIITTFSVHQHGYMNIRNGKVTSANPTEEVCKEIFNNDQFTGITAAQSIHSVIPSANAIRRIQVKVKINGETEGVIYEAFNAAEEGRNINLTAGNITKVIINFNPSNSTQATLDDTWNTSEEHSINYN